MYVFIVRVIKIFLGFQQKYPFLGTLSSKKLYKNVCMMLSLSGTKTSAKLTGPILIKFIQNLARINT